MNKAKTAKSLLLLAAFSSTLLLQGCAAGENSDGKIHITMLQYKPEAVKAFEKIEEKFNATHDDIHLDIESRGYDSAQNKADQRGLSRYCGNRRRYQLLKLP